MNNVTSSPANSLLQIGKSAVQAQQQMLNTTSNNIANVGTDGYVRQRSTTYTSILNFGVGETLTQRLNNQFTQQEVWRDTSANSYYNTIYNQLSPIDKYLSSEATGMSGAILDNFKALQSAVNDPSSVAQRTEFIGSSNNLVNRFNTLYVDVKNAQEFNKQKINEDIGIVNDLVANIAQLNKALQAAQGARNSVTYNLMDQRDAAITELSKYMDIRTYPQEDDVTLVTLATGHSLVLADGNHAIFEEVPGKIDYYNSQINLTYKNNHGDTHAGTRLDNETIGGEIGGLLEVRTEIEEAEKSLGQLAIAMADAYNRANHNGIDLNGDLGKDLFTIAPVTALGSNGVSELTATVNLGEGSKVTTDDFYIEFTSATEYNVYTIARDNAEKVQILSGQNSSVLNLADYGITFTFDNTTKAAGDKFFIQPTLTAAYDVKVAINREEELALASAIKVSTDPTNFGKGTATITNIYNTDATQMQGGSLVMKEGMPASVQINNNGDYEVYDSDGNSLGVADKSCNGVNIMANLKSAGVNVYDPIQNLGYDISIDGKVYAGDQFSIEINVGGVGDNSNGLAMCAMQTSDLVVSGNNSGVKQNFTERYSALTSSFGTVVRNADNNAQASEAKLAQSRDSYENETGVSLDEEAANLVKYQQYYQAAARIISTSQTIFDSLISAI